MNVKGRNEAKKERTKEQRKQVLKQTSNLVTKQTQCAQKLTKQASTIQPNLGILHNKETYQREIIDRKRQNNHICFVIF